MEILPILSVLLRNKLRFVLIAGQIAISMSIGANCVALVLDAREKMSVRLGYDEGDLVVGHIWAPTTKFRDHIERDAWAQKLLAELRALPRVRSVSTSDYAPWRGTSPHQIKAAGTTDELVWIGGHAVDEFFLDTVGLVLDEGRWFTHDEVEQAKRFVYGVEHTRERLPDGKAREPSVGDVVITRALGQRLFGDGPYLGKRIEDQDGDIQRIVGVVRDFNNPALSWAHAEREARLLPGNAHYYPGGLVFLGRADPGKADEVAEEINEWVRSRYEQNDKAAYTAAEMHGRFFGPQRMLAALMTFLVFLLLFVTSLGIAGITSFSIIERTRQIGTRRALGATATDILLHFLTESGLIVTIGLFWGAGLAVLLNMALLRIYEVAKVSPWILGGSALLFWVVGVGAALPPALRASRISPAIATRNV